MTDRYFKLAKYQMELVAARHYQGTSNPIEVSIDTPVFIIVANWENISVTDKLIITSDLATGNFYFDHDVG